jgi:hypothetical protein
MSDAVFLDPQFEGLTMDAWSEMLDRVELIDPGQLEMAAIVSAKFSSQTKQLAALIGDDFVNSKSVDLDNALSGERKMYPRTTLEQKDYDRQALDHQSAEKLINFDGLKYIEKPRYLPKRWSILGTASLPIADTTDNINGWESDMLDPDEEGASKLVKRLEKYSMLYLNSADISFDEDYPGYFSASDKMMMVHGDAPGSFTMTAVKLYPQRLANFAKDGKRINIKELAANNSISNFTAWERHAESLELPSQLFFTNQTSCGNNSFTLLTAIYDGYGKMAPLRRNPQ